MDIGGRELVYLAGLIIFALVGWNLIRTTNIQNRKRLEQSRQLMMGAQEQADKHAEAMLVELRAIRKALEERKP